MKTLGISRIGMNGYLYYQNLLDKIIQPQEKFKVETVNFENSYDYILFDGGSDVTPKYYREEKEKETFNDEIRDEYESKIFSHYFNTDTKFIGICRGSQFLNVMFGGTLYQDLYKVNFPHPPFHNIEVLNINNKYSLNHILPQYLQVNSTHHQAVKVLGKDLIINSWDIMYNVVESYIHIEDKVRATQFHPEFYNDFRYTIPILKWLFRDC